jgi:glycosidase
MSLEATAMQRWWKEATGCQLYPASIKDTNGDGIGDLNGITESLDYLKNLGVDFLWISPVYDSPGHDVGYYVGDYEKIWSRYGTMDDMYHFIRESKGARFVHSNGPRH